METGGAIGQVRQGMTDRILAGGTCAAHPNRWPNLDLTVQDTRVVTVFVAPFGTFSDSGGAQTVPVVNFATFYVTGWGHSCPGDDPVPRDGYIVGHWIKYIGTLPGGDATASPYGLASLAAEAELIDSAG